MESPSRLPDLRAASGDNGRRSASTDNPSEGETPYRRDAADGRGRGRLVTVHSLNLGILHALRCATESLTPGSLLPSLRIGETLSSLRVRYAPFGESPRVLPRSGSSLAHL